MQALYGELQHLTTDASMHRAISAMEQQEIERHGTIRLDAAGSLVPFLYEEIRSDESVAAPSDCEFIDDADQSDRELARIASELRRLHARASSAESSSDSALQGAGSSGPVPSPSGGHLLVSPPQTEQHERSFVQPQRTLVLQPAGSATSANADERRAAPTRVEATPHERHALTHLMPQIEKLSNAATALVRAEKKRLTQAVRDARIAKEKLPRSQCTAEAKQVGLTYKQATGITFQMLIDHLTLLYQHFGIKHFFIVKELHEDKNIHYHVAILVQEKPKHMKWADLDFVKPDGLTKTVDYRAVNWKAWISYISKFYKSDPEWSWSHDPFHSLWKEKYQQGGVADRVAMNIMEGESYYVQKLRHSGFSMLNQTKILAFKKRHELGLDQEPQPPPPPLLIRLPVQFQNEHVFMPIGGGFHEVELDGNPVKMFTDTRDYREKQFWIWGPTRKGKTYLLDQIRKRGFRGYNMCCDNDHMLYSDDGHYHFAYGDDWDASQMPLKKLLKWLAGDAMYLNQKHDRHYKTRNITTIIISNPPPHEVYPGMPQELRAALEDRLFIIDANTVNLSQCLILPARA